MVTNIYNTTDEIIDDAIEKLKKFMKLAKDNIVIIAGGFPRNSKTNFMRIETI